MKKTIAILVLAAAGITTVNAGVRFGIDFGIPVPAPAVLAPAPLCEPTPMPAPVVEAVPVCPTPGYVWVAGNWGWCDNHWVWTRGHWGAPIHREYASHWDRGFRVEHREAFHGGLHREGRR